MTLGRWEEPGEPRPVCPSCRCMVRRDLDGDPLDWRCDIHGRVVPEWEYDEEEEVEDVGRGEADQ